MDELPEHIKFSDVIQAIKDLDIPFPTRLLRGFSDLSRKQLIELADTWDLLPAARKTGILEDLEDIAERDTLVNFDALARLVIKDPDPRLRVLAVRLLWDCEDTKIVPGLIESLHGDPDEAVRAVSASLLGKFVLLGELDTVPDDIRIQVLNNLIEVFRGGDLPQVRQRVLESLGYSSQAVVEGFIKDAITSSDPAWVSAALCAMGRSADDQWSPYIEERLVSLDPEVQFEAIRAAGELELSSSRDTLLGLLDEDSMENETRLALIWALSQIGGDEVKSKLDELLDDAVDEDEIEWIEKSIENLELVSSPDLELIDLDINEEADDEDYVLDDELDEDDE